MDNKKLIAAVLGVTVLVAASAAAISSYTTRDAVKSDTVAAAPVKKAPQRLATAQPAAQPAPVAQQPACDDKNIVGTIAGGALGGIAGSQFGKGSGKTAATVGGVVGGAYLGNQVIPTRNVTCR